MMPSKKKKYNARFPPGRIKKIMQTDEDVGKVAQAVPVIISRALELFVESLLTKTMEITSARNAKTLSPSHMKHCIFSESRFDFLKDLVKSLPDMAGEEECLTPLPPGRPALIESEPPSHVVPEVYSPQEQISQEVPSSFQVGGCFNTYAKNAVSNSNINNNPNCESASTDNLSNYSKTVVADDNSLPKQTVINFYMAGQSDETDETVNEKSETACRNAVSGSGVLPMNQTIPAYKKEQSQPATSSLDLDEDYDD